MREQSSYFIKSNLSQRPSFASFIFFIAISYFLIGCGDIFREQDPPELFEKGCSVDPLINYKDYDLSSPSPKYYVIFIDRSLKFQEFYEQSLDLIKNLVEETLNPNDRIILSWMDYDNFNSPNIREPIKSIFWDRTLSAVPVPSLPTPVNTPFLAPTLTPGPGTTGGNVSMATSVWIETQNKTPVAEYHCQIGKSDLETREIIAKWQGEQFQKKQDFINSLNKELDDISKISPVPGKFVYESFSLASKILGDAINNDSQRKKYILIFLSDMFDWRTERDKPSNYDISSLKSVDVIIAMPNCTFVSLQKDCSNAQKIWSIELSENVKSLKYLFNFQSNPDELSEYLLTLFQP